jgi:hypothetical protein
VRVGAAGAIINIGYHMELDGRVMFHIDGWRDFIMSIHIQTIGQALILTARSTTRSHSGRSGNPKISGREIRGKNISGSRK